MIRTLARIGLLACAVTQPWLAAQGEQARDRGGSVPAGTAVIAGVVIGDDDARQPVRRAIVTLSGGELKVGRSVITNADGRFAFPGLPAGRYTLKAAKGGYLTTTLGARTGGAGSALVVADGESIADVTVKLPRGAVITGTVTSPRGEPLPGLLVSALSVHDPESQPFSIVEPGVTTDDRGVYRIFGLAPGDYYVVVTPPRLSGLSASAAARSAAEVDAIFRRLRELGSASTPATTAPSQRAADTPIDKLPESGYAPIFYPGTPNGADATMVSVASGQERGGIDVVMDRMRMASIEGIVTSAGGLPSISLSIQPQGPQPRGFYGGSPILSTPIDAEGRFRYTGVAPGQYTVFARSTSASAPTGGRAGGGFVPLTPAPAGDAAANRLWAAAEVTVQGEDVVITLELQPALRVAGRATFQGTSALPESAPVRLQLTRDGATGMSVMNGTTFGAPPVPAASIASDGTFQLAGALPGTYRLSATVPGTTEWWLRSAMLDGRDLLDVPLVVGTRSVENVVLTFLDRQSELYGELRRASGAPAFDTSIVVFPTDPSLWRRGARRIRTATAASDGQFTIRGLPGGEYFLAVLPDVGAHRLYDRAFLEPLSRASIKLSIADGERKRQDLRLE